MGKKNNKLKVNLDDDDDVSQVGKDIDQNLNVSEDGEESKKEVEEEEEEEEVKKESKGKMVQRHKMELKKLQQELDKQNHAIPKKDKKAKSEFNEKAKKAEEELIKKQKEELAGYEKEEKEAELKQMNEELESNQSKGPSKAYLKKAQRIKDEEQRLKELEEDKKNFVSKSKVEMDEFLAKLKPIGKTIKNIPADGDCMYSAISSQLLVNGVIKETEIKSYPMKLRKLASDYILKNAEEFAPYIIADDEYASVEEYCKEQVLTQGKWGGHLELKALSHSLNSSIVIYNSRTPEIIIGEELNSTQSILLAYHRHAFTLGEHYNSVIPL